MEMEVLHTPGHSPGSICLLTEMDGIRLLIAGDTLWGGYHLKMRSDMISWQSSIDRLLTLDFEVAAIGHSPPRLIEDAKGKLQRSRAHFGAIFDPWFTWEPV
jgi:glyoxylase-like metal-dependent hydrolase (beta-lactamase superfamily II)